MKWPRHRMDSCRRSWTTTTYSSWTRRWEQTVRTDWQNWSIAVRLISGRLFFHTFSIASHNFLIKFALKAVCTRFSGWWMAPTVRYHVTTQWVPRPWYRTVTRAEIRTAPSVQWARNASRHYRRTPNGWKRTRTAETTTDIRHTHIKNTGKSKKKKKTTFYCLYFPKKKIVRNSVSLHEHIFFVGW